jgi:tRNA wybutosine-synthesizing protein 3
MKVNYEKWRLQKKHFWLRIWEDYEIGYLDRDLIPVLVMLNRDRDIYTTSSCSGRIVVVDGNVPWIRGETSVVFKSHIPITTSDLFFIYEKPPHRVYWLIVTGPIIHFSTTSFRKAVEILKRARSMGFKHSGIMHVSSSRGVFVELVTGVYITQLLRIKDKYTLTHEYLNHILLVFNKALIEGKLRLQKLYEELQKYLPENPDSWIEEEINKRDIKLIKQKPIEIFYDMCRDVCRNLINF